MTARQLHQAIALVCILSIVCVAVWVGYVDYHHTHIVNPDVFVLLLAISYAAHLQIKLGLHKHIEAQKYIWVSRVMIIALSLIPVVVSPHHSVPATQQASLVDINLLPFLLLGSIEGLLIVYCFIFHNSPRGRRGRGW